MRIYALLLSTAILCACETVPQSADQTVQADQIVVTGAKTSGGKASKAANAPTPKPVYYGWDGSVSYGPMMPTAPIVNAVCWDGSQVPQGRSCPPLERTDIIGGAEGSPKFSVEIIPPEYETKDVKVVKTPATTQERVRSVTTKDGRVIQEASTEIITVPPVYEIVTQQVEIKPERYIVRDKSGHIVKEFANADEFAKFTANPYKRVVDSPVSTFSSDVDTASYSFTRQYVKKGKQPPKGSVRIEELINYFDYDYAPPASKNTPFKPTITVLPSPWNKETKLIHIGLKGYEVPERKRPDMNLVFLIDVSGSMDDDNKLPLLKRSFETLVNNLEPGDSVSIVTYGPTVQTVLAPTSGNNKAKIMEAIYPLDAQGGTAGAAGLQTAYAQAEKAFKHNGTNRVILATDGDFNIGISDPAELKTYIETKRKSKIYLSVLGFGQGNVKDNRMQAMAQNGNGTAGYIDCLREARKFFANDMGKNLIPIADDLKIQVEFNPAKIAEYRLIGYETRALKREDFNNDKVDAGDIGSGHTVTAIYEVNPVGAKVDFVDPLRYSQAVRAKSSKDFADEYGFVKLRYKMPGAKTSKLISAPITMDNEYRKLSPAPQEARFATAVAAYGLKLSHDPYIDDMEWQDITDLAQGAKGVDMYGYRSEFIELTKDAATITDEQS